MKPFNSPAISSLSLLATLPFLPSSAAPITFSASAPLVQCPAASSPTTPTQLSDFTGGALLLAPTAAEGDLCILSRVNRNVTQTKKVFIPIARSYDGHDWQRVAGRYISYVSTQCGESTADGAGYSAGDYLCEVTVPELHQDNLGYFLTKWETGVASDRRLAARFLEKATWGATWDEITTLESSIASSGHKAFALWVQNQQSLTPSSHRAFFRQRLSPRAVESYIYGIPGPKACQNNARFRRFAFTYKDLEMSRSSSTHVAGSTGQPMTPIEIQTVSVGGVDHYALKFGGEIRTVLPSPLQYEEVAEDGSTSNITLSDGSYTICYLEEVVGYNNGQVIDEGVQLKLLVNDLCTSSYTNRGGVADGKGDGALSTENVNVGGTHVRYYDKNACDAKCGSSNAKYIQGGNPEVIIPDGFDVTALSWVDLSALDTSTEIININAERTNDASWLLQKDLDTCQDENGDEFPDPAGLAYTDYFSYGRGKYNLDKPIFAKLPNSNWALHDFRTQFKANTPDNPLEDGGGAAMKAASRSGDNEDGSSLTDLVVRCSNVERNIFNEEQCRISYHEDACQSVPLPDPANNNRVYMFDPSSQAEETWKYLPSYAGPDNGGVVVCGSENEVAPIPTEDDHFDVTNRKMEAGPIDTSGQKSNVWVEVVLGAQDQLCQRLAFGLSKIFATSTFTNPDSGNSETNIGVYDNFVNACFSTYGEVMKKVSFNQEMSEQLTFKHSKSVAADWHRWDKLAWPDENYGRENLQLHSIGLVKLNEDGTPLLNRFGKRVANYEQKHIFSAAKVWTSFKDSYRRANYEDLDWATTSYLDPIHIKEVSGRDWFPKITADGGYLGDRYPLCVDLPERHFLKKGATFRLLGGSSTPLWHNDAAGWDGNAELQRMLLPLGSPLYNKLCNPTNAALPASTLSPGTGIAQYDVTFTAPLCEGSSSSCDSDALLDGRVNENNSPNTIDECSDGADTIAENTECVKRIIVSSIDGGDMRGGDLVKIQATVIAYSKQDRVDFYFAADASAPDWKLITIVAPVAGESNVTVPYTTFPDITYTLPKCSTESGCKQAVRVVLRSSRSGFRNDGQHKPNSNCAIRETDDVDDIVFDVLPSPRAQDTCSFETLVTLDTNLDCQGKECYVSTVRVVEVIPGVFYEYLRLPCVHLPFYQNAVKVFAGWNNGLAMCADKRLASARSSCCGTYSDRDLGGSNWADILSEYHGERLTYGQNVQRCTDWGRGVCDASRIGPFVMRVGHCLHRQSCTDSPSSSVNLEANAWLWTTGSCDIKVQINPDGLIAIFHEPAETTKQWNSQDYPTVQSHVHVNKTVSYFHVQWDMSNVTIGKLEYPHVTDNACDGGMTVSGDLCVCSATEITDRVFDTLPTREEVLSNLYVGAFDPTTMFADTYTAVVETTADDGVSVYQEVSESEDYTIQTIFRVKSENDSGYIFLKNVQSTVSVCDGTFFFRNSPTFYDIVDPQIVSAYQEVDAYLDYVDKHSNTPPFVCKSLMKHFGFSNPSPHHVLSCSNAYKSGMFTWTSPSDPSDTVSFGDGDRGDLKAVSASILLDRDPLSVTLDSDPAFGGLKEPLHKLMHTMRSLGFQRSLMHRRTDRLLHFSAQDILGQAPYGTPDQFSFFSPEYMPAGAHIESGLVSPESELLNMKYAIGSQNAYYMLIQYGLNRCWGGIGGNLSPGRNCNNPGEAPGFLTFTPQGDTSSSSNVISQLVTLLTADRLDADSRAVIENVYSTTLSSDGEEAALKAAEVLMVSTPVFHATNKAEPSGEERSSTAQTPKDENEPYKAVIHLNLFGGMDSMNLLVPHPDGCPNLYEEYKTNRGNDLYLTVDNLIKIDASTSDQPCTSFGVNKNIGQGFVDIYNEGDVIFVANAGHLQKPVTASNFLTETTTQLFSHHTMKEESFKVDAFKERDDTGIIGRMTDILGNSMSTSKISIDGNSDILVGDPTLGLQVDVVGARGPDEFYKKDIYGIKQSIIALNNRTAEGSSIHSDLWSQNLIDSYNKSDNYLNMLDTVSGSSLFDDTDSDGLGRRFQMVLRLIKLHESRGVNRDSFAVSMGGFDTHFDLTSVLNEKLATIGSVLKGFRDELVNLGLWDSITVVVSSEFGRTVTPNTSAGTDHGWGGHHIIMGGKIKGGKILGHHPPTYSSDWKYNTGRGVWIPTTSNEGMWFGIAQWFGLESTIALNYALPNMNNFGCRLFSETDLYEEGTGTVPGCGGDIMTFNQVFFLSEPRLMNPDEQKSFCAKVYDAITGISIKCVILDQILAVRGSSGSQRRLNELGYELNVEYEISSEESGVTEEVSTVVNSDEFEAQATTSFEMEVSIEPAEVVATPTQSPTRSPSASPSSSPSVSPTSASPTSSPSASPSGSPSVSPSSSPSVSPTSASPTSSPSASPSISPNTSPTTSSPSSSPSASPTSSPSLSPASAPPTSSPSASPSISPNTFPTTSSPSSSPSMSPTSSPSASPISASPTSSPSASPSVSPNTSSSSSSPSSSPSVSPTSSPITSLTSSPSGSPTSSPSKSPSLTITTTTSTTTTSTTAGSSGQLQFNGRLTLSGIDCSSSSSDITAAAGDVGTSVRSVICSQVPGLTCGTNDKVRVSKICGIQVNAESGSRRLSSDNDAYFTLILNAVESDLRQKDAIIGSYLQGSSLNTILSAILDDIVSSTSTQTLGSITGILYTYLDSVVSVLGLYYPDWGKSDTCVNDGNQPGYMTMNPVQWMYENIEDCCARFYFWDLIGCMSSDPSYVDPTENLFYPDWLGSCVADGNAPAYMKKHYSSWMYSSLEDCCARYYSWSEGYSDCLSAGGIDPSYPTSMEGWYVDYSSSSCVKTCDGPLPCGGLPKYGDIVFTSKLQCCQLKLWWLGKDCYDT